MSEVTKTQATNDEKVKTQSVINVEDLTDLRRELISSLAKVNRVLGFDFCDVCGLKTEKKKPK